MNSNKFYKYKFLTKKAFEFQSKIMSGKIMNFTKAEIGDGTIDAEEAETLQSLKNKICNAEIISIAPKQHMVEITILLNGDGLNEVTLYREIGIYAQIDDEEVLYAYLNSDEKFDYIIPLGEGDQREFTNNKVKITLVVGNAENIKVTINNTTIPDNSVTMDMLNVEIKNYISSIEENLNKHTTEEIASERGSHGFKYDEDELKLKYKKDGVWEDIPTGQQAETEINEHKEKSILSEEGVHDFKYNKSQNEFQYKENDTWNNIDITAKHSGVRIIGGDGVHGIKFDTSDKRLKFKNNSNDWENIPTGQEVQDNLTTHVNKKISESGGVHGIEYVENGDDADILRISKTDGRTVDFNPAVNPDTLLQSVTNKINSAIEKVGNN